MADPVIVIGAGPVGAVCALALAQGGVPVRVLEAGTGEDAGGGRTLALSHGARQILDRLGVWEALAELTPITRIHISQRGALGVTRLDARELGVPALGYVLPYAVLAQALKRALTSHRVPVEYGVAVTAVEPGETAAQVVSSAGIRITPLAVLADGGRGLPAPRPLASHDYGQHAIVCEVETACSHGGLAYERFTPHGPIALLPRGARYSLVWTAAPERAAALASLDDAAFLEALYAHFGSRQGRFLATTPRKTFPLVMRWWGHDGGARVLRIGNAAQTLHPVAGQGLNLGLRDAFELARAVIDTPADARGGAAMRAAYLRSRRLDSVSSIGFTDFLVRVFSSEIAPLRHARGLGLLALEAFPSARRFVARRMMLGARG